MASLQPRRWMRPSPRRQAMEPRPPRGELPGQPMASRGSRALLLPRQEPPKPPKPPNRNPGVQRRRAPQLSMRCRARVRCNGAPPLPLVPSLATVATAHSSKRQAHAGPASGGYRPRASLQSTRSNERTKTSNRVRHRAQNTASDARGAEHAFRPAAPPPRGKHPYEERRNSAARQTTRTSRMPSA